MIDFRYHLVSLISVFLALAVGVVLGAGPLQNTIGDALQNQVNELRADRDAIRVERDRALAQNAQSDAFIHSVSGRLVDGVLAEQTVAVIAAPQATEEDVAQVEDTIEAAGGSVVYSVRLTEEWAEAEHAQYRTTLAGQLFRYLFPAPPAELGTDGVLGAALAQSLVHGGTVLEDPGQVELPPAEQPTEQSGDAQDDAGTGPESDQDQQPVDIQDQQPVDIQDQQQNANVLLTVLATGETPLVQVTEEMGLPASAAVIVGARSAEQAPDLPAEDAAALELERGVAKTTARVLAETFPGAIVVGAAQSPEDLVTLIRADEATAAEVSTMDGIGSSWAPPGAVLGLDADLQGTVGHFGLADSAAAIVPQPATTE